MATEETTTANPPQSRSDIRALVDLIVKSAVILAAIIYGCGYVVISVDQFSHGMAEMNPLRPKVLAAGIWFLFFAAVPFIFVTEQRAIKSRNLENQRWLRMPGTAIFFFSALCYWLGTTLNQVFDAGNAPNAKAPSTGTLL